MRALPLLFVVCALARAHYADPRLSAFIIEAKSSGQKTVQLPLEGSEASCTFAYETQPAVSEAPPVTGTDVKVFDPQGFLTQNNGICTSKVLGFWNYEICWGGFVQQKHDGDIYILAREWKVQGKDLVAENGDVCSTAPGKPTRSVKVSLYCDEGKGPNILHVAEPDTCKYHVKLGLQQVCSDPSYPKAQPGDRAGDQEAPKDGSEDWLMEIVQADDGRVICSAYSTETRATGSELNFTKFSLSLNAPNADTSVDPRALAVCRHPARIPCGKEETELRHVGQIENAAAFNGQLAYVKLTT